MKLLRIALCACTVLFATGAVASHYSHHGKGDINTIGMLTGPKTGTYIAFGRDIARIAAKEGLVIKVEPSAGSVENIERITSREKVGLAIVQSDVLSFLSRVKNEDSDEIAKKLRLVVPFYSEEVHVLARADIKSLADLAGKRVVVGGKDSGSTITAMNIFSLLGITPSKYYTVDPPRGVVAVLNNEADAMVFVGGKPVKMFKNMEALTAIHTGPNADKLSQVHFLALEDARLLKEYKPATITHADYNFVERDIPTIAVTAVLVSYNYALKNETYYHQQCRNMAKLINALQDNLADLKATGHPKWKEVDFNAPLEAWKRDSCTQGLLSKQKTAKPEVNSGLENDSFKGNT